MSSTLSTTEPRPPADADSGLLQVSNLATGYGDLRAVWDVSLTVAPGSVTLIAGRNGAGKTTTLMAICGLLPVQEGSISFRGQDVGSLSVQKLVGLGMSLVPEGKRVFRAQSVENNLLIGGALMKKGDRRRKLDEVLQRFPLLAEHRGRKAGALSGGQQQVLAIGQALMGNTKLLILDEPSAGLAPKIFGDVIAAVRTLASEGVGVLLVEQVLDVALPVADRVVLIDRGRDVYRTDAPTPDTERILHDHLRGVAGAGGSAAGAERR